MNIKYYQMYKNVFKFFFDTIFSAFLLILISPLFLFISLILIINFKGSPFFLQRRPGLNEKLFVIIKFKTMNDNKNVMGELMSDEFRLTKIGGVIRKVSLDEIPQLINVFKGDMSLVGPRPLLPEYLSLYNKQQKERHKVKPGMTGLAQVSGRNLISWREKLELDVKYVNSQSLALDLNILFKTIFKVFKIKEINNYGNNSVEKFNGKN
tara:strand:- start:142 stop:768 length:627 start_codon:yes stop_codon:yes gene_type:complete